MDKFLDFSNTSNIINRDNEIITLTWCDSAENHIGMEIIGEKKTSGLDLNHLLYSKSQFEKRGYKCNLIRLNDFYDNKLFPEDKIPEDAYLLIVKQGAICLLEYEENKSSIMDNLYKELTSLEWDKKYFDTKKQKVVNKHARSNLCFSDISQKSDYINKKGTIISFDQVKLTNKIRKELPKFIGKIAENLQCEGNYYFNKNKCGIGYHGDTERKIVIGIRIGKMVLKYCWYFNYKPIGKPITFDLDDGDLYIMSEKTTGNDWKNKSKVTLRHAAGCDKYTTIPM